MQTTDTISSEQLNLAPSTQTGLLGIMHLKRFWGKTVLKKHNKLPHNLINDEWQLDKTLLYALNLGLEQCIIHIYNQNPCFDEFENWIIETAGRPPHENLVKFNNMLTAAGAQDTDTEIQQVLDEEQLAFWDENGYIIIKNAVTAQDCEDTIVAICDFINIKRHEPASWYTYHPSRQGIMVQLFQHPSLQKNRHNPKIRMAYEQLWQRKDIWVTVDRVGFNPPETNDWKFPGPDLHWDSSLEMPMPFGVQGILYLADTAANQGALTLVPGFQNWGETWLQSLPEGANPRQQNLHALGSKPIAANAGDFIIWHHALPHGSSPNTAAKPRFVQYINYEPANIKEAQTWI